MLSNERGQSIVIIAFALVGLLLFAGLALDAGVIYAGLVNLSRAVDAAALAGVVELPGETGITKADNQARSFLLANIRASEDDDVVIVYDLVSNRATGPMGVYRYTVTVTQQVRLYFLPLVGLDAVTIRDRASAEVNPLVNLYVSQSRRYGQQTTANLSVFGPDSCHWFGDPYSPRSSPYWNEAKGVYTFRLDIPGDYNTRARALTQAWNEDDTNDALRVEIWDPDSYNRISPECGGDRRQPCTPKTGNEEIPFEFIRIDENRCGCEIPAAYAVGCTTTTRYTLYYFRQRSDGSFERVVVAIAEYSGVLGDTDLLWVSPSGFELEMPEDIYAMPSGVRSLFLDVRTTYGASENGFDLWAGPRYTGVPAEVNARNRWIVEHVMPSGGLDSAGAVWSGVGRLPMNSNATEVVTLTLAYIPPEWEERVLRARNFDNDSGAAPPVTFLFDSMPYDDWHFDGALGPNGQWASSVFSPAIKSGITFYGGYLQVVYQAGAHDTFNWEIKGEAAPVLVE